MNICVQVFVRTCVTIYHGYIHLSRVVGSYGNSMFNLLRSCQLFSKVVASFYIPSSGVQGFQFLYILTNQHLSLSVFSIIGI